MIDPASRKRLVFSLAAAIGTSLCSPAIADDASGAPQAQVRLGASTSLETLAVAASKEFGLQYSGIPVAVVPLASHDALGALAGGSIDVAFTDTAPADKTMLDHRIAVLPFAFITNRADGVSSLTGAQIAGLLTGKITNWSQIGGSDVPVVLIGRGPSSGVTHLLERTYLGGKPQTGAATVAEATVTAIAAVKKTSGAVSVVTFDAARAANADVIALALDGATPDEAHVGDGSYPLWAYEHAVTLGAPSTPVSRFLSLVESDRTVLHEQGFIGVSELGPGALALPR